MSFFRGSVLDGQQLTAGDEVDFDAERYGSEPNNVKATRIQRTRANGEEEAKGQPSEPDLESMTAALDAVNLNENDLASIRHSIAVGLLPSDTLSCIVRDFDQVAVYLEQLHPDEPAPPATPVDPSLSVDSFSSFAASPLSFSSLLLPPIERITRPLRAAYSLLCGKRQRHITTVVGHTYKQLDPPLMYDQILPHYIDSDRVTSTIPLFSVPDWPLALRLDSFIRPFGCVMNGGVDEVSNRLLRSSMPLSLRLPVLACRFMFHAIAGQGYNVQYCYPLIDSLIAMIIVLHALEPTSPIMSNGVIQPSTSSTVPHVLFVHDTARLSFPLLLAGGLASMYQSVCSNLQNLSQLLRLPPDVIERLPPQRLLHGPLLLSLLQDAVPRLIEQVANGTTVSHSSPPLQPPPCVSLELLRYRVVRGDVSTSSTSSSHTALQAVTAAFSSHYQLCRKLVYAGGSAVVLELDMTPPPPPPPVAAPVEVPHSDGKEEKLSVALAANRHTASPQWQRQQQRRPQRIPAQQPPRLPVAAGYKTEPRRWARVADRQAQAAPTASSTATNSGATEDQ